MTTSPAEALAEHLAQSCDAALVVDGNADELIAQMLAAGWTWTEGKQTEGFHGKRIRYLSAPKNRPEDPR